MSGSYDARYYDQIITRLHLQGIEENKYSMQQLQQEERNLHGQKSKKKILLVDDEPDSCLVYEVVLQDAGYECISYNDSVKSLQEFRPDYYDLVIPDIRMPKLDGFALRKDKGNR